MLLPRTLEECFVDLDGMLSVDEKRFLVSLPDKNSTWKLHYSLGRVIRNRWKIWDNQPLLEYIAAKTWSLITHPDDASIMILEEYYTYLWRRKLEGVSFDDYLASLGCKTVDELTDEHVFKWARVKMPHFSSTEINFIRFKDSPKATYFAKQMLRKAIAEGKEFYLPMAIECKENESQYSCVVGNERYDLDHFIYGDSDNYMILKDNDYNRLHEMISRCRWTFAKTMPWCPHEYIVRGKCPLSEDEFLYFVDMQRRFGIPQRWGPYNHPYLHIDGYKYWTMGDTYENTVIINRAKE